MSKPKAIEVRTVKELVAGSAFGESAESFEIPIVLGETGDPLALDVLGKPSASQLLAEAISDLNFHESLGSTGIVGRRMADFRFDDPDATVVMSHEQLEGLLSQMNARDTIIPSAPRIPVFEIGDQRTLLAARLLSGGSQVYGPRQPTPVVNLFGIEGLFGETFGADLYRVEGYGKDTGIRTEQDVQRVMSDLQASMKPEDWKSVAFLFSNDAASRGRILDLRTKVADRLGGRCKSITEAREAVFDVLKSGGTDLRALDQKVLFGILSNPNFERDNRAFQQAFAGFKKNFAVLFDLIFQILPDNIPVYRGIEAAYMGGANRDGKSYWGVGDVGLKVAREYGAANEGKDVRIIQTTVGELRSRGVIKPDHVAVLGNAIEFFHGPDGLGGTTVVPYRVVE